MLSRVYIYILFIISIISCSAPSMQSAVPPSDQAGSFVHIIIDKSDRQLDIYRNDVMIKRYNITFGQEVMLPKEIGGDSRTPEGEYYVTSKNDNSRFYKFIAISYPNTEDAMKAYQKKLITRMEVNDISNAIKNREQPRWDTALGGWIGIHGTTGIYSILGRFHTWFNWTEGCIAVKNSEIDEIWDVVTIGDKVLIQP